MLDVRVLAFTAAVIIFGATGCSGAEPREDPTAATPSTLRPDDPTVTAAVDISAGDPARGQIAPVLRVDLPYLHGTVPGTTEETGNCRAESSSRCEFRETATVVGTHIATAEWSVEGFEDRTPDGCAAGDDEIVREAAGRIETAFGDVLHVESKTVRCESWARKGPWFWVVVGGDGRFANASGTMGVTSASVVGFDEVSSGTLSVEASRWADVVPESVAASGQAGRLELVYGAARDEAGLVHGNWWNGGAKLERVDRDEDVMLDTMCAGAVSMPARVTSNARLSTESGDEIFGRLVEWVGTCAGEAAGMPTVLGLFEVTGGTGRFTDVRGRISTFAVPELGISGWESGSLSVLAELWPEIALFAPTRPAADDELSVRYWEQFLLLDDSFAQTAGEDCVTELNLERCEVSMTGRLDGVLIGEATEIQSGSEEVSTDPGCPGEASARRFRRAEGTITSPNGDGLDFVVVNDSCAFGFWAPVGGTGRFDGATGLNRGLTLFIPEGAAVYIGEVRVAAELWADLIPAS